MLPREFYGPYSTYGPDSLVHPYSQRFPLPGLQYENYCAGYKSGRKIELEKVRGQNCKICKRLTGFVYKRYSIIQKQKRFKNRGGCLSMCELQNIPSCPSCQTSFLKSRNESGFPQKKTTCRKRTKHRRTHVTGVCLFGQQSMCCSRVHIALCEKVTWR